MRRNPVRILPLLAACLLAAAAGHARGDERAAAPPDRSADSIVFETLREVTNKGVELYNRDADYAGCWRLYEGGLMAVRPFLAHRPDVQESITKGLAAAYNEPSPAFRAHALRKVINGVRSAVNPRVATAPKPRTVPDGGTPPAVAPVPAPPAKALWDRLGGEANVRRVVDDFVTAAAPDPKVNFFRDGKYKLDGPTVASLKRHLVELISAVSEGPLPYTGKDMKTVHAGMGITDAEFDRLAGHLKVALEKNGAKPDDVKAVLAAVNNTRGDIVEKKAERSPTPADASPAKPGAATAVWDRLGGEKNVARVIDDLFATAGTDPKVNFIRHPDFRLSADDVATLKTKVRDFISAATGGPYQYTGKDMKTAHKGMKITDAEFDAFAGHLQKALQKNGASPDDVKAVMGAVGQTRKDIVEKKADK
jgi:hemoglobin